MEENKPKQTRKRKPRSKGLGDTVEKITTATGIKHQLNLHSERTAVATKEKNFSTKSFLTLNQTV